MNLEDKRKLGFIALAIIGGITASLLTGNYITTSIDKKTDSKVQKELQVFEEQRTRPLYEQLQYMAMENQKLASQQAAITGALTEVAKKLEQPPPPPPITSLAVKTPTGKRAIALRIDSLAAVGGMIHPSDRVDIMGHLNVPDRGELTLTVFQNVEILSIGPSINPGTDYGAQQSSASLLITFALDPQEVELITFAQKNGGLQLSLRPPTEKQTYMLQAATWRTLADYIYERQGTEVLPTERPKAEVEAAPQEAEPYIQIFKAGQEL